MKLAEALILRADYQKRIEQIKQRLTRNAKIQEGDEPAETPANLIKELERISKELLRLIQRINATNSAVKLEKGLTISDAIAVRDVLRLKHTIYRDLAEAATVTHDRYTKSEVKYRSTVNVSEIQKQADELAKEHREIDAKIQEANWCEDLIE
jgi:hypothetical protein